MTRPQAELIGRLVAAEQGYWMKKSAGEPCWERDRTVEVSRFVGVDPRTVRVLEAAGLVVGWNDERGIWLIRLADMAVNRET